MSEESLPVQPLTLDDGQDGGRGRRSARLARAADAGSASPRSAADGRSPAPEPIRRTPAVAAIAATGVGYALIAGGFRRLTIPAELGTFVAGSFITWLALRKDCRRHPAPDHVD